METLFTCDARGRMLRVNEPDGKDAPRFFLGRTAAGNEWRIGHDVDDRVVRALESACLAEPVGEEFLLPPHGAVPYEEILARTAPVQRTGTGPAYRFPRDLPAAPDAILVTEENADVLRPHLEEWLGDVPTRQPMAVVVVGGRAVSLCASVRIGAEAHEAGVETAREHRRRGYGARAVTAWATAVRARGRIPLYSTSWTNEASQGLARTVGLLRFGSDLHIE